MEANQKETMAWDRLKKPVRDLVFLLIIAAVIEIIVFNFRSIQSLFYQEVSYKEFDYTFTGAEAYENDIYSFLSGEEHILHINNINSEVRNVRIDIEILNGIELSYLENGVCKVGLDVCDEGNVIPYRISDRNILHSNEASKYAWMQLYGDMKSLDITITTESGYLIQIHDITFNAKRPILFSFVRCLVVFITLLIIYGFRTNSVLWKADCIELKRWQWGISAVLGLGIAWLFWFVISKNDLITYSDQYAHYQELAQALDAGQTYLLQLPPEELAKLDNPYDPNLWQAVVEDDRSDYAYYDGKYYISLGILPCLIFYLPFYRLTGLNLPNTIPIMIGAILFGVGLFMLLKEIIRKYFKEIPFAVLLLLTSAGIFGCQIPEFVNNPTAADVPLVTAMALNIWGLYLWIASTEKDETIHVIKLLAGSVCMALVTACVPSMVIYSFLALPIFIGYLKKKHAIRNIAVLLVPYIITAAGLMYYNFLRFGSISDFGNSYTLTSVDLSHSYFSLDKVILAINCFLLKLPEFNWTFPYIRYNGLEGNPFGHCSLYMEQIYAGLLVANPILWTIFALYSKKSIKEENRLRFFYTLASICAFVIMVFAVQTGRISYRYIASFSSLVFVVAGIAVFVIQKRYGRTDSALSVKRMITVFSMISVLFHINLLFIPNESFPLSDGNTELFYRLFYGFNFW